MTEVIPFYSSTLKEVVWQLNPTSNKVRRNGKALESFTAMESRVWCDRLNKQGFRRSQWIGFFISRSRKVTTSSHRHGNVVCCFNNIMLCTITR